MRLYIRMGASYKYDLAKWLINDCGFEKCYIDLDYNETQSKIVPDRVKEFGDDIGISPMSIICESGYWDKYDVHNIPMLSKEDLEFANQYESMAIHIAMRGINYPVQLYDRSKCRYIKYLRFWKNYLIEEKIDYIFFNEIPHNLCNYSLYVAARLLDKGTFILHPSRMKGVTIYGYTIETMGASIKEYYDEVMKNYEGNIELSGRVGECWKKLNSANQNCQISSNDRRKQELVDMIYKREFKQYNHKWPFFYCLKNDLFAILRFLYHHDIIKYRNQLLLGEKYATYKAASLYIRNSAVSLKDYNRMAGEPDYSEQFIYFPLQQYPECTTVPTAGMFRDQYTAIALLARIAETEGVKLYVKEHFVQPFRDKQFWYELGQIENVRLIKTGYATEELLKNAVASATQTGAVILESVVAEKPVFVFGGGHWWKGTPGVYEISDEAQGKAVLKDILRKYITVSKIDVEKYFYAIEKNSIEDNIDINYATDLISETDYQTMLGQMKALIDRYILRSKKQEVGFESSCNHSC